MASKKNELKKSLSTMQAKLTKTEKNLAKARSSSDRWKQEARAQRKSAARSAAWVEKLQKKLDRASAALEQSQETHTQAPDSQSPVAEPGTTPAPAVPDESWTMVQLKAEARDRGLVGMSSKPKADLLAALA